MEILIYTLLTVAYICIGIAVSILWRVVTKNDTTEEFDKVVIFIWPIVVPISLFLLLYHLAGKVGDWVFYNFVVPRIGKDKN